ncbi:uncharacterized protein LOC119293549 [Triticum dicoccoides]|uniref:uncharacterized protein LOC119293549 n=1 Tax=Triticum dicoccoides TaxID=85692 RepID=UPI000E78D65E|nr:uncharacterized protein LOC119293549 [Triticum dicoccoides]
MEAPPSASEASMELLGAPKASEVVAALAGQVGFETVFACDSAEVVVRERGCPRGYTKRTILGPISTNRHWLPRDDIIQHIPSAVCTCFASSTATRPSSTDILRRMLSQARSSACSVFASLQSAVTGGSSRCGR